MIYLPHFYSLTGQGNNIYGVMPLSHIIVLVLDNPLSTCFLSEIVCFDMFTIKTISILEILLILILVIVAYFILIECF